MSKEAHAPGDAVLVYHSRTGTPRDATGNGITLPAAGQALQAHIGRVYSLPGAPEVVDIIGVDAAGGSFVELGVTILQDGERIPDGGRYAEYAGRVRKT